MSRQTAVLIGKTGLSIILLYAGVILFSIILQFVPGENLGKLASPIGLMLAGWLMYRWFDRQSGWSVGWQDGKSSGNLIAGGMAAAIIIALSASVILFTGTAAIGVNTWSWIVIIGQVFLFLSVAAGEEWLFRGYLFGLYKHAVGIRTAVFANTFVFTAVHLLNPDSLSRPAAHVALEMINIFLMGILMSQARLFTGSLWMPIGLHFMLNFVQSTLFGFVNGGKEVSSIFSLTYHELNIWNGAAYGLESSLIFTPVLLLAVAIFGWIGRNALKHQMNEEELPRLTEIDPDRTGAI